MERVLSAPGTRPLAVASINLDHFWHFGTKGGLVGRLGSQALDWAFLIDGAPVALVSSWRSHTKWERLTGADLLLPVLELAASRGFRVGFLGGTAEMHERLDTALAKLLPSLRVAGYWAPLRAELFDDVANSRLVDEIASRRVDILVVGLGKPRQEQWMARYGPATGARLLLGFGAAADFVAGSAKRAPVWMRESGMEWLFRLRSDPRRLAKRYLLQGPVSAARMVRPNVRVQATRRMRARSRSIFVVAIQDGPGRSVGHILSAVDQACAGIPYSVAVVEAGEERAVPRMQEVWYDDGYRRAMVIDLPGEVRLGAALNATMAYAGEADAIAVLRGDVLLEPGSLKSLYCALKESRLGVAYPAICDPGLGIRASAAKRIAHFFDAKRSNWRDVRDAKAEGAPWRPGLRAFSLGIERARGRAFMLSRECIDEVGPWDDHLSSELAVADYAWRVQVAGWSQKVVALSHLHLSAGYGIRQTADLSAYRRKLSDVGEGAYAHAAPDSNPAKTA